MEAAQAAARLTPGGDTITVEDGVQSLDRPLTLTAADSGTTITRRRAHRVSSGGGRDMSLIDIEGASDITLDGLGFVDTAGSGDFDSSRRRCRWGTASPATSPSPTAISPTWRWACRATVGANHVTVSDSRFTDTWGPAINFNDGASQNTATGNTILRSGSVYTEGGAIQMYESWGNTISHNSIRDIPRHGIEEQSWDPTNRSGGNVIDSNRITNYMGATEDGGAIYLFGGDDPFTPIRTTIQTIASRAPPTISVGASTSTTW